MQKTADRSNKHTNQIISVTYICIQLPTSNLGNDLVTELLLKSALSCLLQIEQFYATCLISTSLPISLHIFRYFFIFLDQLLKTTACFTQNDVLFCTKRRVVFLRPLLPLSHRWEKIRTEDTTRRKNTVLFYRFCKTYLSNLGYKQQKTVYFTPKMGRKTAFFSFFFDFSHQHRKKTIE